MTYFQGYIISNFMALLKVYFKQNNIILWINVWEWVGKWEAVRVVDGTFNCCCYHINSSYILPWYNQPAMLITPVSRPAALHDKLI